MSRRTVKYYKLHFGFREPYKVQLWLGIDWLEGPGLSPLDLAPTCSLVQVLLDGNFLHAITQLKCEPPPP